jgi:predicted aspartyl protease
MEFESIWDTGASSCAISNRVVSALGLKPTGMTTMRGANGEALTNTYLLNLYLPNGVAFSGVRVAEVKLVGNEDILIGMDVISAGDFTVSNYDGKTCMSFRIPSQERTDYVPGANAQNAAAAKRAGQIAHRNQKDQKRQFVNMINKKHR